MSLLEYNICLFLYVVPIPIQAFVQMLHKPDNALILEVGRQSI
jgi:hypothetical protein